MQHDTPAKQATLELETGTGEPPTGALLTADGLRRAFCGWIELATAIEDWRQAQEAVQPPHRRETMR